MDTNINLSISGDAALRVLRAIVARNDTQVDDTEPTVMTNAVVANQHAKHVRLTAEQKTQWAQERRSLVNMKITQPGPYEGALIIEHVKGTLYRVMLTNGEIVNVKHKKQKTLGGDELGAGWSKWVD